jgi:hypothetical protein
MTRGKFPVCGIVFNKILQSRAFCLRIDLQNKIELFRLTIVLFSVNSDLVLSVLSPGWYDAVAPGENLVAAFFVDFFLVKPSRSALDIAAGGYNFSDID